MKEGKIQPDRASLKKIRHTLVPLVCRPAVHRASDDVTSGTQPSRFHGAEALSGRAIITLEHALHHIPDCYIDDIARCFMGGIRVKSAVNEVQVACSRRAVRRLQQQVPRDVTNRKPLIAMAPFG